MTSKKNQIRILVVGLIVFLTVSYVLAQEQEKPKGEIPQENNPPQIVSIEFNNVQNEYTMTVTVVDRDSKTLKIEVQHIGGRPDLILFPQSTMPIAESKGGTFISDSFSLAPGSHTFVITATDSDDNQVEMSVTIFVPESVVQLADQPPQIVAVGFSNDGNNYTITVEIKDEDPRSVHVEIEGAPHVIFTGEGTTFTSNQFSLPLGLNMLIIIATDSQGSQDRMQITIDVPEIFPQPTKVGPPPQIASIEFINEQNNYVLIIEVEDKNPESVYVHVDDKTDLTFEKGRAKYISDTIKRCAFISDLFHLMSGYHTFTIIAEGSDGAQSEMQMTITVPQISTQAIEENQPPHIVSLGFRIDQDEYTMVVKSEDEDSYFLEIDVQHKRAESTELEFIKPVIPVSETAKRGVFSSYPFILESGSHGFTITVRDSEDNQAEMQMTIVVPESVIQLAGMNQPPQVISVGFDNEGNNYTIKLKIEDENPGSVQVYIKGRTDIEFKKGVTSISDDTKQGTFTSDTIALDPGSHTFTIIAEDSEGNETEMQTTIDVPSINGGRSLIILIILLLSAIVILEIFFFRRRSERTESIEGILYCKQCKAPLEPSDDLEKENILEELRKKLDHGEITEEEYHKIAKSLKEGFQ